MFSAVLKQKVKKTSQLPTTTELSLHQNSFRVALHDVTRNLTQSTEKVKTLLNDKSFAGTPALFEELLTTLAGVTNELNKLTNDISSVSKTSINHSRLKQFKYRSVQKQHFSREEPAAIRVAKRLLSRGEDPKTVARKVLLPEHIVLKLVQCKRLENPASQQQEEDPPLVSAQSSVQQASPQINNQSESISAIKESAEHNNQSSLHSTSNPSLSTLEIVREQVIL